MKTVPYVCKKCNYEFPTDWHVRTNPRIGAGFKDIISHFEGKCPMCSRILNVNLNSSNFTKKGITL